MTAVKGVVRVDVVSDTVWYAACDENTVIHCCCDERVLRCRLVKACRRTLCKTRYAAFASNSDRMLAAHGVLLVNGGSKAP